MTRVEEVMATQEGRDWWMENGDAIDVTFTLKKNSYSMKTLEAYLKEKIPVK